MKKTKDNIHIDETMIPLDITTEIPSKKTQKAIENIRNGIRLSNGFSSVSELLEGLYSDT